MGQAQILGSVFVFFGLTCAAVSTVLDVWCYVYDSKGGFSKDLGNSLNFGLSKEFGYSLYFGLWQFCKKFHKNGRIVTQCKSWLDYHNKNEVAMTWLKGCQAMMIFGVWFYGTALLSAVVCIAKSQQTRGSAVIAGLGGMCCTVATILFAANMNRVIDNVDTDAESNLHAGFGLAVSAVVFGMGSVYFLWRHTPAAGYQNIDVF